MRIPPRLSRTRKCHVRLPNRLQFEPLEERRLLAVAAGGVACNLLVTTPTDVVNAGDAVNSLREAIICANSMPGPDIITVPAGTYTLTIPGTGEDAAATGDLDITDDLTINGAGAATTIIQACAIVAPATSCTGIDRVFDLRSGSATISAVTIRNGSAPGDGGGINSDSTGDLTLTDAVVSGNASSGGGGGMFVCGEDSSTLVTLTNVRVSGNSANGGQGGGMWIECGQRTTITNSTISDNTTSNTGGGISNDFGPELVIANSTFSSNTADDDGGGIDNSSEQASLTNVTISDNTTSREGGGIFNVGIMTLLNVTIANNSADVDSGGGIQNLLTMQLKNTILADNGSGGNCGNETAPTSLGHNLEDADTCGFNSTPGDGDLINTNPQLGSLADNGGPTQTLLPASNSPAINNGDNTGAPATDQRGIARPQPPGGTVDIGAVEVTASAATFDFGDAPAPYPSAQHAIDTSGPFLGTVRPDAEAASQPDTAAQGDDNHGTDDEECCTFTSPSGSFRVKPGEEFQITYHVNGFGFANVWVDLNHDGFWNDTDEHVVVDEEFDTATGGEDKIFNGVAPTDATPGNAYVRVRVSTDTGLGPGGSADDGEVEDYRVIVLEGGGGGGGGGGGKCTAGSGPTTGAGNVTARIDEDNRLVITGDDEANNIRIGRGARAGSLRITGRGGTHVNGGTRAVEFRAFDDVLVSMGDGNDVVAFVNALIQTGLRVQMEEDDDLLILCGVDARGRVQTGEGLGNDTTTVNDSVFHDEVEFGTGNDNDQVNIETEGKTTGPITSFRSHLKIRTEDGTDAIHIGQRGHRGRRVRVDGCTTISGGEGPDTLDAGLTRTPNGNGNVFTCGPEVEDIEHGDVTHTEGDE